MKLQKNRIGLIGCGHWGKNILRDLVSLNCQVTVVARTNETKKTAKEGGANKIVNSISQLEKLDGYVVATPSTTHAKVINKLLDLFPNTPIYTEKPMTTDLNDAKSIYQKAPNHVFVMDKWRYHPGILELAKIAKSKELGEMVGLKLTRVGWGNPHDDIDTIWHLIPHEISISLEIIGNIPTPTHATADIVRGEPFGLIGNLGVKPWVNIQVSGRSLNRRREFTLYCQDGIASLQGGYDSYISIIKSKDLDRKEPPTEKRPISEELPLIRELKTFIDFINGGPPPKSSAKEGAQIVETITKLRQLAGIK
jgi:predicted dehydrogenase